MPQKTWNEPNRIHGYNNNNNYKYLIKMFSWIHNENLNTSLYRLILCNCVTTNEQLECFLVLDFITVYFWQIQETLKHILANISILNLICS